MELVSGTRRSKRPHSESCPIPCWPSSGPDAADKDRFIHLPDGLTIGYEEKARWQFPVGTILVKTFSYPLDARDPSLGRKLMETRLLVHESSGWTAHTYVWDEAQKGSRTQGCWGDHFRELDRCSRSDSVPRLRSAQH